MDHGSAVVEIHHKAGMAAANAIDAKQSLLVDCNASQGSTFGHRNNSRHNLDYRSAIKSQADLLFKIFTNNLNVPPRFS